MKKLKTKNGFTLLEVLIVLTIMSVLTLLSTQNIQQAIKAKLKLQVQIDDFSQVRDSLKVIERDINLAFHYTDLELEMRELLKKKRQELCKPAAGASQPPPPAPGSPAPPPMPCYNAQDPTDPLNATTENRSDPVTHFIGKDNEIYFATQNASRLSEGIKQADFVKVAYLLQTCRKPGGDGSGASKNCLVRRTASVVEGDITKGGENIVLLEDVSEFKLRYFGKGKQDWVSDWNSKQGDSVTKNRFPDSVEINLTIGRGKEGETKKKISMQMVVPIRFPNNQAQDRQNAASPGGFVPPPPPPGGP
jgi:prepilin-type N-terminal cleavage/methylation domain-containing protein